MEQPVCKHNQRGFCKFGEECTKYHENEICRDEDVAPIHVEKGIQEAVNISEKMEFVSLGRDVHICIVRRSRRLRSIY